MLHTSVLIYVIRFWLMNTYGRSAISTKLSMPLETVLLCKAVRYLVLPRYGLGLQYTITVKIK